MLYTKFILLWRGPLGKGINTPLPACVLDGVRETFPSSTGMYNKIKRLIKLLYIIFLAALVQQICEQIYFTYPTYLTRLTSAP